MIKHIFKINFTNFSVCRVRNYRCRTGGFYFYSSTHDGVTDLHVSDICIFNSVWGTKNYLIWVNHIKGLSMQNIAKFAAN